MGGAARRVLVLGLDGGDVRPARPAGSRPGSSRSCRWPRGAGVPLALTSVYPAKTIPAWYSFATGQDPGLARHLRLHRAGRRPREEPDRPDVPARRGDLGPPLRARASPSGCSTSRCGPATRSTASSCPGCSRDDPHRPTRTGSRRSLEADRGRALPARAPRLPGGRPGPVDRPGDPLRRAARRSTPRSSAERYHPDFLFALLPRDRPGPAPALGRAHPPASTEIGSDLKRFWRTVDWTVARIDSAFRAAGGPAVTLVISDHGHGVARSDFFTNRWLAQEGYLVFKPHTAPQSLRRRRGDPLLLASDRFRPDALARPGPGRPTSGRDGAGSGSDGSSTGAGSFESMAPHIDWEKTVAFSYPVPEGIYLNRYNTGPHPGGGPGGDLGDPIEARGLPAAHIEVFDRDDPLPGQEPRPGARAPPEDRRPRHGAEDGLQLPRPDARPTAPATSTGAASTGWKGS